MEEQSGNASREESLLVDASAVRQLVGYHSFLPDDPALGGCSLRIGPQHLNRSDGLHGGLITMLLDNACAIAVRRSLGAIETVVMTLSLTVNFVAPARSGCVTATGRVTSGGRKLKFVEGELRHENGQLLATASAVFKVGDNRERTP